MRVTLYLQAAALCILVTSSVCAQDKQGTPQQPTPAETSLLSPIYGVGIPPGYRAWELVATSQEGGALNELRGIVGNSIAIKAYQEGKLPFPDGSVIVKIAWKEVPSPEFETASIPGAASTVQVMVKDSKRYAATGGWGFGRFLNGKPVDEAQHKTCFGCHEAKVKGHDYVFTRWAP